LEEIKSQYFSDNIEGRDVLWGRLDVWEPPPLRDQSDKRDHWKNLGRVHIHGCNLVTMF